MKIHKVSLTHKYIGTLGEWRFDDVLHFSFLELSLLIKDSKSVRLRLFRISLRFSLLSLFVCWSWKEVLVWPNAWYVFAKILNIKFDGILGRIRKYRFRYNLIVFLYFKGPVKNYFKVSGSFPVILNFYSRLNSIFGQNSQNGKWKMNFFSIQLNF